MGMYKYIDIRDTGAVSGTHRCQTEFIQAAIDQASRLGVPVVIAEGEYLSGSLFLPSNSELIIESDGVLRGSADIADYQICETRFEGGICRWPLALVNCIGKKGVRIHGEGILDGNGCTYWHEFWSRYGEAVKAGVPFADQDVMRPRLIYIEGSSCISVSNLKLVNAAFWNIHLYNTTDVMIDGISIQAPHHGERAANSDGIDIDCTSNVTIRNIFIENDGDCICLKSGKGPVAHTNNQATQNILIENCRFGFGHGMVTFGSEATTVRNITIRNCEVNGENNIFRIKLRDDTQQLFENILFENICVCNGAWLFDIQKWETGPEQVFASGLPAVIRNFIVRNIRAENMKSPGIIGGTQFNCTVSNMLLDDITVTTRKDRMTVLDRFDKNKQAVAVCPDRLLLSAGLPVILKNVDVNGSVCKTETIRPRIMIRLPFFRHSADIVVPSRLR